MTCRTVTKIPGIGQLAGAGAVIGETDRLTQEDERISRGKVRDRREIDRCGRFTAAVAVRCSQFNSISPCRCVCVGWADSAGGCAIAKIPIIGDGRTAGSLITEGDWVAQMDQNIRGCEMSFWIKFYRARC